MIPITLRKRWLAMKEDCLITHYNSFPVRRGSKKKMITHDSGLEVACVLWGEDIATLKLTNELGQHHHVKSCYL